MVGRTSTPTPAPFTPNPTPCYTPHQEGPQEALRGRRSDDEGRTAEGIAGRRAD